METETPKIENTEEVIGIYLGIVNPVPDDRGNYYGDKNWKNIEDKIFKLRRRLQKKGTKSAKRHLKKLSGRQRRFRRDCDHVLSKRIVESVATNNIRNDYLKLYWASVNKPNAVRHSLELEQLAHVSRVGS